MLRRKYIILINFIIIFILFLFYILYFGSKYIKRLDAFIYENNKIIIKNELNTFINSISNLDYNKVYNFQYNDKKEIIGANYNINYINKYIVKYTSEFKNNIKHILYSKYVSNYFKKLNINNNTYLVVPIGIVSNNPFLYNFGPNIFLSYDFLTTYNFYLDFDAKNYGLNNTLVNLYLTVEVEQSIFKPTLETKNKTKYRFLISSQIVYGRFADFLSAGINMKSSNL